MLSTPQRIERWIKVRAATFKRITVLFPTSFNHFTGPHQGTVDKVLTPQRPTLLIEVILYTLLHPIHIHSHLRRYTFHILEINALIQAFELEEF